MSPTRAVPEGSGTVAAVEATERFLELCRAPEPTVAVEELALLVAAHATPGLDVGAQLSRLDDLAGSCPTGSTGAVGVADLVDHLFVRHGFTGDRRDYYDPRNSYLDAVLDRHLGIPITLSILAIAVGRRRGVRLAGVSMPGHFLTRDVRAEDVFVDAFEGVVLDTRGCVATFRRVHGDAGRFDPGWLRPVGSFAVIARVLANLKSIFLAREDRRALRWCLELRAAVPGVGVGERRELAAVLAATGAFGEAAAIHDELAAAARAHGDAPDDDVRAATRLRARMN